LKLSKKTWNWITAILCCVGILSLLLVPPWLGALIFGAVCGLAFEPWKR